VDTLNPQERSERMARVRSKDTKPEMRVRRLVHALGYRYRLHDGKLPGRPDLVFPGRKRVVFVHGCFWHQHRCPRGARMPKSRPEFWRPKLEGNRRRDARVVRELRRLGWRALVVWECRTGPADAARLADRLIRFLGPRGPAAAVQGTNTSSGATTEFDGA